MVKNDMQNQLVQMLLNDALALKNMPQTWIDTDVWEDGVRKRTTAKHADKFDWMGDGSDDHYDYCERMYDAWGVTYECDKYQKLEEKLNKLVESYRKKYPDSVIKASVDGCKCDFELRITFTLSDKDFEKQLRKLERKNNPTAKTKKDDGGNVMSERGKEIMTWLQGQPYQAYSAREIAEGLFCSPRAIPGAMKKLINDGFVVAEKVGSAPNQYKLSQTGNDLNLDEIQ